MFDAVASIDILAGTDDSRDAELDALRGEKVADRLEDDPRFNGGEARNTAGSFEALMAGWGTGSHGQALDTSAATAGGD